MHFHSLLLDSKAAHGKWWLVIKRSGWVGGHFYGPPERATWRLPTPCHCKMCEAVCCAAAVNDGFLVQPWVTGVEPLYPTLLLGSSEVNHLQEERLVLGVYYNGADEWWEEWELVSPVQVFSMTTQNNYLHKWISIIQYHKVASLFRVVGYLSLSFKISLNCIKQILINIVV